VGVRGLTIQSVGLPRSRRLSHDAEGLGADASHGRLVAG